MKPAIFEKEFEQLLRNFRLEKLDASEDTIYAIRNDLTLVYVNRGWSLFAAHNGGEPEISTRWPMGQSIQNAIPDILRPFFSEHFSRCLETRCPWHHQYQCSSPETYREFMMTTYPLGDRNGLLIVNSLLKQTPHNRISHLPLEDEYRNKDGIIIQCVHCRRVQRGDNELSWDWIPDWLSTFPENTSHGLCDPCYGFYYPK
jgi:hypothetical protein